MFTSGAEKMFTGEAGTLAYLFFVLLASLIYVLRAIQSSRSERGGAPGGFIAALTMLMVSRYLNTAAVSTEFISLSMIGSILSAAGIYLVFNLVIAGDGVSGSRILRGKVLLCGAGAGIILGGGFLAFASRVLTGSILMHFLYSFLMLAPVGFLVGSLWSRDRAMKSGLFLPVVSALFFISAALVGGMTVLGITVDSIFWKQLYSLLDLSGFFTLLASTIESPGHDREGEAVAAQGWRSYRAKTVSAKSDEAEMFSFNRLSEIDRGISSGNGDKTVYGDLARFLAEETGSDLVLLRLAEEGKSFFEVKGCHAADGGEVEDLDSLSINKDACEQLCKERYSYGAGYSLTADALGEGHEALVPAGCRWEERSVVVVPVMWKGSMIGLVTVGFFDGEIPSRTAALIGLYANKAAYVFERNRWKSAVRGKERELSACKEELEGVNQLKANFLSIVSHELRTPLTSVKAYTETLLDNLENIKRETIQNFLNVMAEENERLIKLVDNILDYYHMETGYMKAEKASCNLNDVIVESHMKLQRDFLASGVDSELKLPTQPVTVDADKEMISQLLENLIGNAVKFTPRGGRVTITLEEEAAAARLIVRDTGKGIPEEQLEKIFERFYQVDGTSTREHGGSGLGLAICKNIVDWHGGKIWVENVKEAGTKFTVLLPTRDVVIRLPAASGHIGSVRFEREKYMSLLVEMLAEFVQARKASIMLLDKDQQILQIIAAKGLDPEFVQNTKLEIGERIAGRVFQKGEPLHVLDIEKSGEVGRANNAGFYGTHSFISVPLYDGAEIIGVLNVSDNVEGKEFSAPDREIMESLAMIISGMLKKLNAYETVSSNFEKLKDAMRNILDLREARGSRNISNLTLLAITMGKKLGLDEKSLTAIRLGMNLYDLGIMKIPRNIRAKKEELTDKEWEKLKQHPDIGFSLVSPMSLEKRIMRMIRSHHENYDGTGYPDGLAGVEIPVEASIVNIVDSFRALISQGPYRRCYSADEARSEIIKGSGTRFDPKVVGAFVKAFDELGATEDKCGLVLVSAENSAETAMVGAGEDPEEHQEEILVKEGNP